MAERLCGQNFSGNRLGCLEALLCAAVFIQLDRRMGMGMVCFVPLRGRSRRAALYAPYRRRG